MENNRYKDYEIVIEKLNSNKIDYISFMGIASYIIYSKEIFPRNKDIVNFLKAVFGLSYLDYVIKSRSLIAARITRHILEKDKDELSLLVQELKKYIEGISPDDSIGGSDKKKNKSSKRKNANEKLDTWLKGL